MNYDKIIGEIMVRIKDLEYEVKNLKEAAEEKSHSEKKVYTVDIRDYIASLKKQAISEGKEVMIIRASEIHKQMNLKSRYPMVCNAMRQSMLDKDEVINETASGYSSSLEIKYYLK